MFGPEGTIRKLSARALVPASERVNSAARVKIPFAKSLFISSVSSSSESLWHPEGFARGGTVTVEFPYSLEKNQLTEAFRFCGAECGQNWLFPWLNQAEEPANNCLRGGYTESRGDCEIGNSVTAEDHRSHRNGMKITNHQLKSPANSRRD